MCGILGVVGPTPVDDGSLRDALSVIAHRGPDGEGYWRSPAGERPAVALGHRRLAIIDLSPGGAQPMTSEHLVITYNGEIYNYRDLRTELEGQGHAFRTQSDTEVLLRAYAAWGAGCLERLNGMFAFAIWDRKGKTLFAARDRFGEKPFHYVWDASEERFAFASEVKALLALPGVDGSLNEGALHRYATRDELAGGEETLWGRVRRLPAAHSLQVSWSGGRPTLEVRRYWDIDLGKKTDEPFDRASQRFHELFADSIRLRLQADVPVGTSLSGGLDSSAIVCQIRKAGSSAGQSTFTARMDDPALDEGRHARMVVEATGVSADEVWVRSDALPREFDRLCYHLEEPIPTTSPFAQFLVMRLARQHGVKVLLDGQGADEVFAGYRPYFLTRYKDLAESRHLFTLWRESRAYERKHAQAFPLKARALVRAVIRGQAPPSRTPSPAAWWRKEFLEEGAQPVSPDGPAPARDQLTLRQYADTMRGGLQELLRYGDRNSMASSVELRTPFLDHRLVEHAFSLPAHFKLSGGESKVLVRRALRDVLPAAIAARADKLGYQPSLLSWLRGPLRKWALDRLAAAARDLRPYLDEERLLSAFNALDDRGQPTARSLFAVMTLGACLRTVGDRSQPASRATIAGT